MTHEWVLAPVLAPTLAPTLGLYKQFLPLIREVTDGENQDGRVSGPLASRHQPDRGHKSQYPSTSSFIR